MFVSEPDTSSFVEITSVTVIRMRGRREEGTKVGIIKVVALWDNCMFFSDRFRVLCFIYVVD